MLNTSFSFIRAALGLAVIFGLGGCASVSVTSLEQPRHATPRLLPEIIYVEEFKAPDDSFRVDRTGAELVAFKKQLQTTLATEMVARITKHIAPAQILNTKTARPKKGWLVRGHFVRVNQGSRALRVLVGLGLGGTKMETEVEVFDLARSAKKPFLTFQTTGGSNAEPGVITGVASTGPIDAAIGTVVGGALVVSHGITEDAKRTAHETTATLSEYAVNHGWLPTEKALQFKRLEADSEKIRARTAAATETEKSSSNSKRP